VLRIAAVVGLIAGVLGLAIPLPANQVATVFVLDRSDSVGRVGDTTGLQFVRSAADTAAFRSAFCF